MENSFKKTILHVYSSWTAGGAEKLMLSLADGLEKKGLNNIIACPGDSYMFKKAGEYGLKACPLVIRGSFDPFGLAGLRRIVLKEKVDIIHAHQGKVFWPCVFMKLFVNNGLKLVFHRHAQLPHRFYSRSHYRFADRVIAISKAVAEGLVVQDHVQENRLRTVYNGTDFDRFRPEVSGEQMRKDLVPGARIVIGTVAAMNRPKGKGQEYLIEAAQIARRRFPDVRYLIVGTGPLLEDLKKLAVKLRVDDIVVFAGYRENVEEYIAAMDIFCFLSWDTEGFGQVMVEAQGMGKPVIGTTVGGIPETFQDGVTGVLIPPRDSEFLAQVLVTLLDDEERRKAMGVAALKLVHERFGMEQMVNGVIDVYKEMF